MPREKVRKEGYKDRERADQPRNPDRRRRRPHLGDFIEDKAAVIPLDAAIQANLREATTRVLSSLTPRGRTASLRMRFGIGMNTDHTLEEVGQQFNVTAQAPLARSRRRRCENSGTPSRSRKLRSFLDD